MDNLLRFAGPRTLVYASCEDPEDVHFRPLEALARQARSLRDFDGHPYRLVPLPLPRPLYHRDGRRLPASYVNFLIINRAVLMPIFHDPADLIARDRLMRLFPGRQVVGVDARAFVTQNGGIHCLTMQIAQP